MVFEEAKKYCVQAEEAGIMLFPGCGFDVVPSDCLSLHLKNRLPDAKYLEFAFAGLGGGLSRGISKSMVEGMGHGGKIRKDHKLVKVKNAHEIREIDYGSFKFKSVTIPWGDIATAYFSTGIPNIKVFTAATPKMLLSIQLGDYLGFIFRQKWVKKSLLKRIEQRPAGPSEEQRKKGESYFFLGNGP